LQIEMRASGEPSFPALRSGVHWGPVLYREGDYVGGNVNIAARLAEAAGRHDILVSAALRREAGGLPDIEFVPLGKRPLKGVAEVRKPIFARWIFQRVVATHDAGGGLEHRRELLAGLSGRVIEVGAGIGSNFGYYPRSVKELVATEPETYLRSVAMRAAETAPIPVRVVEG